MELEKWQLNLSNQKEMIPVVIATASKIGTLWKKADLETKKKIQNLVFPEGVFWDKKKRDYRTKKRNAVFELLDRISVGYGNEKGPPLSEAVPLCGWGDSNPHAVRHQILSLGCLPISTHPQVAVQI